MRSEHRRPVRRAVLLGVAGVVVAAVVLSVIFWPEKPTLSTQRNGDPALAAEVAEAVPDGGAGLHRLSVAVVDLKADEPVRYAGFGADEHTPYEAGSITKAMTGQVIADAIERGEVSLDTTVGDELPVGDSAAAKLTLRELVTHRSGLPSLDRRTFLGSIPRLALAGNPYGATSRDDLVTALGSVSPKDAGSYAYSNLGASTAGQLTAAAAGMSYEDLMQRRLFTPLGLSETHLQTTRPLVDKGFMTNGTAMDPWVETGYAPSGAVVSTSADLATFATAVLRKEAPGMKAVEPLEDNGEGVEVGIFWHQSTIAVGGTDRVVTWHNGETGGYHSFLGLDRKRQRAVVILSDVANEEVDDLGFDLITR